MDLKGIPIYRMPYIFPFEKIIEYDLMRLNKPIFTIKVFNKKVRSRKFLINNNFIETVA